MTETTAALPWPLTDEQIDGLSSRELDAYVEQVVFGNSIVGFAPVEEWGDGYGEQVELSPQRDGTSQAAVFLSEYGCCCSMYEADEPRIHNHCWQCFTVARRFSEDWNAMRELLECMKGDGFSFAFWDAPIISSQQRGAVAAFAKGLRPPKDQSSAEGVYLGHAIEMPRAVCRAALKARR